MNHHNDAGKLFRFEDGVPKITKSDESTVSKNVFLVGPHVQHGGAIFCFIYKYDSPTLPPSIPFVWGFFYRVKDTAGRCSNCCPINGWTGQTWQYPLLIR